MIDDRTRARAWKNINEGILLQDELKIEYGRMMLGRTPWVDGLIEKFRGLPDREKFLKGNIKRLSGWLA